MEELKSIIARNLVECRKAAGLTQLQLAEKLNYSDKAVSKWERGESLPDVAVLYELANLYDVTLDYFVCEHTEKMILTRRVRRERRQVMIALMSCLLVWVVAVTLFSFLLMAGVEGKTYLIFLWAVPVTFIICVVFSCLWWNRYSKAIFVSLLLWSTAAALFFTIPISNIWLIFIIAVPLQVLVIFWFVFRAQKQKEK